MDDEVDAHIVRFFEEDALSAKINRAALGLEVRITFDDLFDKTGAKLVNQQGKVKDVDPKTVECYWGLQSLIYDYTKQYGKNPGIEVIKNKWTTPARKRYYY
ncbi:MAG: hypothetical protein Q7S55_02165 [Nanoarchaeota archaeon]|nr:hypothetical protein [Nanoarchaeota archaeon]